NGNTFSEIGGGSFSVLAFVETPIGDGWRARFYSSWQWEDGPNPALASSGTYDLQGVATALYGSAIGLPPSMVLDSTMNGIVGAGGSARSIEASDIAAIQ